MTTKVEKQKKKHTLITAGEKLHKHGFPNIIRKMKVISMAEILDSINGKPNIFQKQKPVL